MLDRHFPKKLIKAIKTILKTFESNKKNKNEDFLSVFNRIGIDPFKKIYMKKVILNKEKIYQNDFEILEDINSLTKSKSRKVIVSIKQWQENKKILKEKNNIGIILNSDESVNIIKEDINYFKMIQFNFLTFKDGRPFSEAKNLELNLNLKMKLELLGTYFLINIFFC